MYYDVIEARVIGELAFEVRFSDGLSGNVRFLPSYFYGVFEKFKHPDFFNQLKVSDDFVPWSDEVDLAPDIGGAPETPVLAPPVRTGLFRPTTCYTLLFLHPSFKFFLGQMPHIFAFDHVNQMLANITGMVADSFQRAGNP